MSDSCKLYMCLHSLAVTRDTLKGNIKWKRRFEQYRIASGLAKEDDERQVSTLLYCLGEEADDVLTSTNITVYSRKKFADVLQKFDEFFKVRKNVAYK